MLCSSRPTFFPFKGVCHNTSDRTFKCECAFGWRGNNCERLIDWCENVICRNGGLCFKEWSNFSCECTAGHTGHHCEVESASLAMHRLVKRSCAYSKCFFF